MVDTDWRQQGVYWRPAACQTRPDVPRPFPFNRLLRVDIAAASAADFDLLIRNGRIVDGSGNPWFTGDVAVRDDRIVGVSRKLSGSAYATEGPLRRGNPHPRNFGTFPRLLDKYVREEKLLSLEDAVRKITFYSGQTCLRSNPPCPRISLSS